MPSSASSSSSVQILDVPSPRRVDPIGKARAPGATVDNSDTDEDDGGESGSALSRRAAERFASSFRSRESLDALCRKHGVPEEFTPIPAGDDRRACSPPPPGAVCVYAHALEAGMRLPLHPFFCDVLGHFGVAPSQIAPNGWRIMAAFLALSRSAGVAQPPPVAVFRHFFGLSPFKFKGWYCFRGKDTAGALFTGLPTFIKGWKEGFFFLRSPAPWPCPVLWGEPTKSSTAEPVLTGEEKSVAAKLLIERGFAPIDLRTYLTDSTIAAATMIPPRPPPPPPSPSRRPTGAKGMDASTYAMMQNMRAEKESATADVAVKSEPGGGDTPVWTPSSGKRKLAEDKAAKEEPAHGTVPATRAPPGFSGHRDHRKPQHAPDRHDGDTADSEVARQLLEGIVTPSRERALAAAKPTDVIGSTYIAILQAANYATFSVEHARRLQDELERAKAELAEAKKAAAAEAESAKAAAVEEFLGSKEHERRLVEEALKGYERGMEDMKRVAVGLCPGIDESRLVVPPGGFQ
ncbi:hypothetical protein ACP70R_041762 [Stipagrostis hirtigluma subsp. patula]